MPLISLDIRGFSNPFAMLRLVLGLAFILFIPVYLVQLALFPARSDLNGISRLGLSFGLSVAVVPPIALLLNELPWGLRLWPIVVSFYGFIGLLLSITWLRRTRLPVWDRFLPRFELGAQEFWKSAHAPTRMLVTAAALVLMVTFLSGLALAFLPSTGEQFTEFYILGDEGMAEAYPKQAVIGQPVMLTTGVINREGQTNEYIIMIQTNSETIQSVGPFSLKHGAAWEESLEFTLLTAAQDQAVDVLLAKKGRNSHTAAFVFSSM
jgi:uncharacterized membrane protein